MCCYNNAPCTHVILPFKRIVCLIMLLVQDAFCSLSVIVKSISRFYKVLVQNGSNFAFEKEMSSPLKIEQLTYTHTLRRNL